MNEKPGLEPGFFCSTSCWRLDGLGVATGAEHMLGVPPRGLVWRGLGNERIAWTPAHYWRTYSELTAMTARSDILLTRTAGASK